MSIFRKINPFARVRDVAIKEFKDSLDMRSRLIGTIVGNYRSPPDLPPITVEDAEDVFWRTNTGKLDKKTLEQAMENDKQIVMELTFEMIRADPNSKVSEADTIKSFEHEFRRDWQRLLNQNHLMEQKNLVQFIKVLLNDESLETLNNLYWEQGDHYWWDSSESDCLEKIKLLKQFYKDCAEAQFGK